MLRGLRTLSRHSHVDNLLGASRNLPPVEGILRDELKECHVDTTLQNFEKGVFTLKTNQMSFVCTAPKNFLITDYFWI